MAISMVTGAPWVWKWRRIPDTGCTGIRVHASSGALRILMQIQWKIRSAQVREERWEDLPSSLGMRMTYLGVGEDKGEILGLGSGVGVKTSTVDCGGDGTEILCTSQGGGCAGDPTRAAQILSCIDHIAGEGF